MACAHRLIGGVAHDQAAEDRVGFPELLHHRGFAAGTPAHVIGDDEDSAARLETLLQLYAKIAITPEVYSEVVVAGEGLAGALQVATASWIEVRAAIGAIIPPKGKWTLGRGELTTASNSDRLPRNTKREALKSQRQPPAENNQLLYHLSASSAFICG